MPKKIVIIGPESTGKSSLCEKLARHFHTDWVPEFAREYLTESGIDYNYDDLLSIAQGQIALEDEYVQRVSGKWKIENGGPYSPLATSHSPLFIDTDMYVLKIWCEFVFNKCHRFILDQIVERKYDLYLLCGTDLPWEPDLLREYPDPATRRKLYSMYKDCMVNQPVPWVEISGGHNERLQQSIIAVNSILDI